jgi:hypothetical protein
MMEKWNDGRMEKIGGICFFSLRFALCAFRSAKN